MSLVLAIISKSAQQPRGATQTFAVLVAMTSETLRRSRRAIRPQPARLLIDAGGKTSVGPERQVEGHAEIIEPIPLATAPWALVPVRHAPPWAPDAQPCRRSDCLAGSAHLINQAADFATADQSFSYLAPQFSDKGECNDLFR